MKVRPTLPDQPLARSASGYHPPDLSCFFGAVSLRISFQCSPANYLGIQNKIKDLIETHKHVG